MTMDERETLLLALMSERDQVPHSTDVNGDTIEATIVDREIVEEDFVRNSG